jgi:hypothetical protein
MKLVTQKKATAAAGVSAGPAMEVKVTLPPNFTARVNQMAHRKGKAHAEMWRITTMTALQARADNGSPLDQLSIALAGIERDPAPTTDDEINAAMSQLKGEKP